MNGLELAAVRRAKSALDMVDRGERVNEFSIASMVKAYLTDSWRKEKSSEYDASAKLTERYGVPQGNFDRIPGTVLRDLNVANSSQGGHLAQTEVGEYLPALQPVSVAFQMGARPVSAGRNAIASPRGTSGVTTTWLSTETSTATETQPVFGQVVGAPKLLSAFCEVSRQLLLQSNAEDVLRAELRNGAAAAVDAAVHNGPGAGGQPLGIIGTAGIGTFSGGTLNRSGLTDAQLDVATANAVLNPSTLGYVTTPAIANTLANRADTIETTKAVWQGGVHAGTVTGLRAMSTTGMPAATMIYGDWSQVWVVEWEGGLQISIDPFTKFKEGIVGIRLLLPVDVVVSRASAFSVASSIT